MNFLQGNLKKTKLLGFFSFLIKNKSALDTKDNSIPKKFYSQKRIRTDNMRGVMLVDASFSVPSF